MAANSRTRRRGGVGSAASAATATSSAIANVLKSVRVSSVQDDAILPYTLDRATAVGRVRPMWDATKLSFPA